MVRVKKEYQFCSVEMQTGGPGAAGSIQYLSIKPEQSRLGLSLPGFWITLNDDPSSTRAADRRCLTLRFPFVSIPCILLSGTLMGLRLPAQRDPRNHIS